MKHAKTITAAIIASMFVSNPIHEPATRIGAHPQLSKHASRAHWRIPIKWQRLAQCESRGHIHANRNNTYYGLWQIHKGWFKPFNIDPATATIYQQFIVANHVYKTQGAKAWTCAKKANFR